MGITPTLGKDRWLTTDEAIKLLEEQQSHKKTEVGQALLILVKRGQVRVWLCADGQVRYQYESVQAAGKVIGSYVKDNEKRFLKRLKKDK